MKTRSFALLAAAILVSAGSPTQAADWTDGMKKGTVSFKSIGPLAFGPDGILFAADSKAATVTAILIEEEDSESSSERPSLIKNGNAKIAAVLGTSADDVLIDDLAINPLTRSAYLAVSRGRGPEATPILVRIGSNGQPEVVALDYVTHAVAQLPDAPIDGVLGEGRRASNPRLESITDIAFLENRVLIAGLANEEFASTFRAIPFPFETVEDGSTVEIFHGAHGRFETRAPIRTFVPFQIGNEPSLLAAYTCTPLVQFPISDVQPGAKIEGKTIAELGNRNRPLDMVVYTKGGVDYLLLANSSRGVMKIDTSRISGAGAITDPVREERAGVEYETIDSWQGIVQLDLLDESRAVVLREAEEGGVDLEALALP